MGENIAPFLEFVNDWFTILNVSSSTLEIRLIDSRKAVMRLETEEMRRNNNFFENIAKLMNEWTDKKFTKGTKFNSDTMKAVHRSSITMTKAIPNLLMTSRNQNLGLDYRSVLLKMLTSTQTTKKELLGDAVEFQESTIL